MIREREKYENSMSVLKSVRQLSGGTFRTDNGGKSYEKTMEQTCSGRNGSGYGSGADGRMREAGDAGEPSGRHAEKYGPDRIL